jgi:hypothetical protein
MPGHTKVKTLKCTAKQFSVYNVRRVPEKVDYNSSLYIFLPFKLCTSKALSILENILIFTFGLSLS